MKVSFAATLAAAAMSVAFAEDFCDQWGQTTSGPYIIYNNLWGSSTATSGGKQCTGLDSGSGDTVAWHTTWSWQGGDKSVKSFANAALEFDPVPLTEVTSIPSTMAYTVKYSGNVVADVAYDLFTSSTADGEKEFEIMIWLAAIGGAGPISSTGQKIDSTTIAGTEWSVYSGPNGQMMVYSFVASKQVENFEGDLMEFFNYLVQSQSFKNSQYLIKVECGTEPFVGTDVTMTVSKYSAVVNTGAGSSVQEEASGSTDASTPAATTASASSTAGSSSEQTPATSTAGSSEQTPVTSTAGSSAETETSGSSDASAPATSSTGSSSEQTPATSTAGSGAETETSGSSDETETSGSSDASAPATSSTGASSEQTPATSTAGSGAETETSGSSDETETSGSSDASAPATSSTGSSSEQTTTAPSTGSSWSAETPAPAAKCSRRIRRE